MLLINLNKDLTIDAVSKNFKVLMRDQARSLKSCFFLSMVDCEVPDQLAEDLYDSLKKGLVYNVTLKVNVLANPDWFDVSISPRFEGGNNVGYQAVLQHITASDIDTTASVYSKISQGEMSMKQGWPVQNNHSNQAVSMERWDCRVK
ncbi:hypothetical protein [Thiomicrorhabdus lithotrophica]|uniref:Uncharacterized protein n=1 Tax=Thiomicrorhabdus lithotrophica TaxID=2949997 RepID=A0ABY8C8H1_9GAMM|nr:hypothetical protein [Thiomicrorhabdus lithotrophica]WEJ61842.1 hypothetical protein NR989_07415 [Thiomicrorhabdus lithotrophica]